ncbi:MAG: hypothetical protein JWQ95_625, partial [Sphaerisporangium sp.]|nr:hypothetical protein [Sphaerisporangium sp.]
RGWPTILLLSAAFGLVQAGLIDQSLFHLEFAADDPAWATEQPATPIPGLRIDARNLLNFVGGHMIWSFAAPIAVVESCVPRRADRPWLGRVGLSVMVVLYLGAAAIIFSESNSPLGATPAQMIGTSAAVLALAVAAFAIPRRSAPVPGRVPPPWLIGCGAAAVLAGHQQLPGTWAGAAMDVLALGVLGALLLFWSGRTRWGRKHVLTVAGAALVVNAVTSFWVEPLGNPSYAAKYAANTVMTLGVLALLAWAFHRLRHPEATTGTESGAAADSENAAQPQTVARNRSIK